MNHKETRKWQNSPEVSKVHLCSKEEGAVECLTNLLTDCIPVQLAAHLGYCPGTRSRPAQELWQYPECVTAWNLVSEKRQFLNPALWNIQGNEKTTWVLQLCAMYGIAVWLCGIWALVSALPTAVWPQLLCSQQGISHVAIISIVTWNSLLHPSWTWLHL